ncbi:MAG: PorP/SprF family type IX secretion system membrane protein [Flavobacteriaceae bacterium]
MYKKLTFLILCCFLNSLWSQEDLPLYQDYLSENYYVVHPAMLGHNLTKIRVATGLRKQWLNQKKSPTTQLLSLEYNPNPKNGLGLLVYNDSNGYNSLQATYVTYSYRIYFNNEFWNTRRSYPTKNDNINELRFGISAGRINRQWNRSHIDPRLYDPLIGIDRPNFNDFLTFDVGMAYLTTRFSIQATVKNLAFSPMKSNPYQDLELSRSINFRRYLLGVQYEFYTLDGWNFEPSILFQHSQQNHQNLLDLNFKVFRILGNGRLWGGFSYRRNDIGTPYSVGENAQSQSFQQWAPILGLNLRNWSFTYFMCNTIGEIAFLPPGIHTLQLAFVL